MVVKRLTITLVNIFFPPLAVLLVCGPEADLIINCLLFLAAVLPSHVHAFYISCTYFNRKRKVRKQVYPGNWRWGIYSEKVQNGGASQREIARLKRARADGKQTDSNIYEGDWSGGRSKSSSRSRAYGSGYAGEAQQVPYERSTRTSEYYTEVQQAPGRTRSTDSSPIQQDLLSRTPSRRTSYR